MPGLYDQQYLMAKTETAIGTENAPTLGLSVVKVYNLDFQQISANTNTARKPNTGAMGAAEIDVAGAFEGAVKCETYLCGSGTAGTAPAWAPLLIGCGWQQDWTLTTSVVFKPATVYAPGTWTNTSDFAGMGSLTMHSHMGDTGGAALAKIWKLRGCMGDFSLEFEYGKPAKFAWEFQGAYVVAVDDPNWTAATISAEADPVACMNVGLTWTPSGGGSAHTPVVRKFAVKNGASKFMRGDMNSGGGYKSALVTSREMTYSMQVEVPESFDATAGADWYGHFTQTAAAHGAFAMTIGATAGNIATIALPKASFRKVTPSNGDGVMLFDIEGMLATTALSTGGDEATITLT